jgi:hypothetical protein
MRSEKYGTARQATDDNIIRRMRIACWLMYTIDTLSEYVILTALSTATVGTWTYLTYLTYMICLVFIPYFLRWKYGSYDETFIGKFDTVYSSGKYRMSTDPVHNLKRSITCKPNR